MSLSGRAAADDKADVTVVEVRATRGPKPRTDKSLKDVAKAFELWRWNVYEVSSRATKAVKKGSKTRFALKDKHVIDVELKGVSGEKRKRFDLKATLLRKSGRRSGRKSDQKYLKVKQFELKVASGKYALVCIEKDEEGQILCFSAK